LNKSAAWLWKEAQAQGDFTVESLTERLCEEYDVTAEEVKMSGDWHLTSREVDTLTTSRSEVLGGNLKK